MRIARLRWRAGLAAIAAAALTACAAQDRPTQFAPAPTSEATTMSRAGQRGGTVSDERVVTEVHELLSSDPAIWRHTVEVLSTQGVVTLDGTVHNRLAERRAVADARVARGVRAVVDHLTVTAPPVTDAKLDSEASEALANDGVTAGQYVIARSDAHVVTLAGKVDSPATRQAAENDVLALPGVRDVVDRIEIDPVRPGDAPLQDEAMRAMLDDPWVDTSHVLVWATHGILYVSGWVSSEGQLDHVIADARSATPRGIDASGLRIDRFADDLDVRRHESRAPTRGTANMQPSSH